MASSQNLKQFLKDFVGNKVTMTESDRQANVKIVKEKVELCIECMKEVDPLFKEIYQNIYYAGSFYEGLKVGDANEFDLNIRLKLPFKPDDIQVVHADVPKGLVMFKLKQPLESVLAYHPKWDTFKSLDKIMNDSRMYLSQAKLNVWLQSVVDRALKANEAKFPNVKRSCHGPAKTLNITSPINGANLDVDLVPVVELGAFPASVKKPPQLSNLPDTKKTCFIVPKPCAPHVVAKYPQMHDKFFRVSIPDAERFLMENKGCVKMLIKIFKAIRDLEHWTFLASYYIKTMFMWEMIRNPQAEFWKEDKLDSLFISMLQEFKKVMTEKSLSHIFFKDFNLMANLSQGVFNQVKSRLEVILKMAQSDVPKLYSTYGVTPR